MVNQTDIDQTRAAVEAVKCPRCYLLGTEPNLHANISCARCGGSGLDPRWKGLLETVLRRFCTGCPKCLEDYAHMKYLGGCGGSGYVTRSVKDLHPGALSGETGHWAKRELATLLHTVVPPDSVPFFAWLNCLETIADIAGNFDDPATLKAVREMAKEVSA